MDLKATKATPALRTKKSSPKSGLASSTAAASPGSKNTWRGLFCEDKALKHYQSRGYECLRHRWKSPFAEIDLVFRSPEGAIVLVEVKSVISLEYLHVRLTPKQKGRLQRCWQWCLEKNPGALLELAVVSQQGEVLIFQDIFG